MKEWFEVGSTRWEGEPGTALRRPDGSVGVSIEGHVVTAWVSGDHVCIDGRVRSVRRAPPRAAAAPPVVTPPMPAVVGRILVGLGDAVVEGQALVTVVAMKMEVTLRSPRAGAVTAIRVTTGDKVGPGDVLVEVA